MQSVEQTPPQQRGTAGRQTRRATVIGSGGIVVMSGTIPALLRTNAPWWAIALVGIVLTAISCGLVLAQLLLPQDSKDRLEWWRDRRRHLASRQRSS